MNSGKSISNKNGLGLDVVEHINSMMFYWDSNLVCRFTNYACMDWFNATPLDIIDKKTLGDLLGIKNLEKTQPFIKEVLEGKEQVFKIDIPMHSGEIRNAIATFLPDIEEGAIKGFYAQIIDVSSLTSQPYAYDTNNIENSKPYLTGNYKPLLEVIVELKANLTTGFPGITNLSKKILVSESKLKRDFKVNYGTTVFDYYRHLQMELAEKYFFEKKSSKKQMASLLNFSNPSNFSTCFRKYIIYKNNHKLITVSEKANGEYYQTFINQLPVAAAMFDKEMLFMAASQKWIDDNKLSNINIEGKNFYEIFPGSEAKYKKLFGQCLTGAAKNIETQLEIEPDSSKRLRWNISPWVKKDMAIGGLFICSADLAAN